MFTPAERDRVGVGAPVDDPVLRLVVAPDELLDLLEAVVRPLIDLVQEEGELTLEGGRAVGVVVGEARALVRTDEDDSGHPHLDVLGVLEVAVVHVRAFVARLVDVGEVAVHRHRDRDLGHAVEKRDRIAEAMPVDGVRVVQVRPGEEPDVGEDEEELLVLVDAEDRRGKLDLALEILGDLGDRVVGVRFDEAEHVQVRVRIGGPAGQGDVPVGRHEPASHGAGRHAAPARRTRRGPARSSRATLRP